MASVSFLGIHASGKSRESVDANYSLTDPFATASLSANRVGAQACCSGWVQLDPPRKVASHPSTDGQHAPSARDCGLSWNRVRLEIYMHTNLALRWQPRGLTTQSRGTRRKRRAPHCERSAS